jgi:transposase
MNRSETVDRLEELTNTHDEKCKGCVTCTEIKRLRARLLTNPKVNEILSKGPDMTKSDVAYLIDKEIHQDLIKKAIRLHSNAFYDLMRNWGFSKRKGENEMAKLKEFTELEYQDLKAGGLNDEQIAEKKGVSSATIWNWKKKNGLIGTTVYKPDREVETQSETKGIQEDLKAENGRLKRELEVREKAIKDLKEEVASLSGENAKNINSVMELEADYNQQRSFVINLDQELENTREQLRQAREESVKYGKENEHLWGLLKIKMEG